MDEKVLEKLQPHQNLKLFTLDGYRCTRFPSWLMRLESALPSLTQVTLCNLSHCIQLPRFEHLINLEILEIHNAPKIKGIQTDLLSFRKLKILSFREMRILEEWSITGLTNETKLEKLEIHMCPRVTVRPYLPCTYTSVIIESSMSLSSVNLASPSSMSRISKMYIENCNMTFDEWGGLGCYVIKDLEIKSCEDLYSLPQGIEGITSLESLTIDDCNFLSSLLEWLAERSSLSSLSISRCPKLKSLPLSIQRFAALKNFHIRDCCPELVEQCDRVIRNIYYHSVMGEEANYDMEDLLKASVVELLGKGVFGTTYKAKLDENGQVVAVKRVRKVKITEPEFRKKINVLIAMNHPNLMPLCAYSYSSHAMLLVYDFMPIGSLSSWLHGMEGSGQSSLNWSTRSRIALAVARGLKYIHAISPQCAHGNIKASNALLSGNNGFPEEARIAENGLAHVFGGRATDGYKAPELIDFYDATQKSDVYSFGVLLMELLTRSPYQLKYIHISLPDWVQQNFNGQWIDAVLSRENQKAQQEMTKMLQLAIECVSSKPERQPTMEVVAHQIEDICKLTKDRPDGTGSSIDDSGEGLSTRIDL